MDAIKELEKILKSGGSGIKKLQSLIETIGKVSGLEKVVEALKTNIDADRVASKIREVEEAAVKTMNVFGSGREHILAIKANLVDSVTAVTRLGKDFSWIASTQDSIATALGRNLIVNSNIYEKMAATEKVTGQNARELTTAFKNIGFSVSHISDEMKTVVDISRGMGVNASQVSSQVLSNIEYMNRFNFQGGVEGMAKMAAQATSLRISMKDTLMFAERVYNPEGAIEMASALQRLGVTQSELLDPLRLMDLSLNDPTELQNQIAQMTRQFVDLNEKGQFEILPGGKLQLKEIADAMKINYEEITKMALGSAELERKMQSIRFPSHDKFADEKTRQLIANMAEMDKESGEYKISFTTKDKDGRETAVTKNVSELDPEDIEALAESSKPKEMIDLAEKQLNATERVVAAVNSLADRTGRAYAASPLADKAIMAQVEVFNNLSKSLSAKLDVPQLRKQFTESGKGVLEFLETGELDPLKESFKSMRKYFSEAMDETIRDEWPKTIESLKNSTNEFIKFFAKADFDIDKITKRMGDVIKIITGIDEDLEKEDEKNKKEKERIPNESDENNTGTRKERTADDNEDKKESKKERTGDDLVSYPGSGNRILTGEFGDISLNKKDMIIAGDPNKLLPKDDYSDIIKIMSGIGNQSSTQTIKNEGDFKISLDINVNSNNSSITSDQMERILEDRGIISSIRSKIDELSTNIGRTSPRNPIEYNKNIVNQQYNTESTY